MGLPEASRPKDEVRELPALTALREHLTTVGTAKAEWERTLDAIPDLIFILDRHHRIRRANRAAAERLALPFKELLGRPCYEVMHGLSQPHAWCPHVLTLQDGSGHQAEVREDKAGGWFLVTTTPLLGPGGRLEGSVHVARDITERKAAENALRESEALFRAVFENAAVGIALADGKGRWVGFNRRFEEIIGYRQEELVQNRITDVTHPEDRLKTSESIREIREGRKDSYRLEKRYIRKDGTVVWVDAAVAAIRDPQGRLETLVGAIVDISERKDSEEALKRRLRVEKQLSAICARFVSATDTAAAIRAALKDLGLITEADCAVLALFGGDDQRLERAYGWREDAWTDGAEGLEFLMARPWKERLDRGEAVFLKDLSPVAAADPLAAERLRSLAVRSLLALPLRTGGRATGVIALRNPQSQGLWNGEEQRLLAVQADVIAGALERERTAQEKQLLAEQFRQAQKMEALGRMAGGIAHDFNNVLTVINGYADLCLAQAEENAPLRAAIQEIRRAGQRAAILTRQLLAFSRRQPLDPKIVDLNEVLGGLQGLLNHVMGEGTQVLVLPSPSPARVKIDRPLWEQAILNLAINARDAMPSGGTFSLEISETCVSFGAESVQPDLPPGPYVVLSVRDTGTGMSPEVCKRIFEPFFTTKESGRGTGLGLAMVFGTVRQSGGQIRVQSAPGKGTTFTILLPRAEEKPRIEPPDPDRAGGRS